MTAKWLDREMITGPYLFLATSEADYQKAMRRLKIGREKWSPWLADDALGCVHTATTPMKSLACIVCIRPGEQDGIEAASTIVHEAVHVWQIWCEYREEREPSREFEAYAIENISRTLLKAYADTLG